jgi:hypothetical protein
LSNTDQQYDAAVAICQSLFEKKMHDYGCAWRILRTSSLTDQIFIKAQRIRTLQQNKTQKVDEGQVSEFIDMDAKTVMGHYSDQLSQTKSLMEDKNHDYGEAWRDMRVSSLTDLILQKLLRVKQIEDNNGHTLVSEGLSANYQDMINYALFALIHLNAI